MQRRFISRYLLLSNVNLGMGINAIKVRCQKDSFDTKADCVHVKYMSSKNFDDLEERMGIRKVISLRVGLEECTQEVTNGMHKFNTMVRRSYRLFILVRYSILVVIHLKKKLLVLMILQLNVIMVAKQF